MEINVEPLLRNNVIAVGRGKPTIVFAHGFGCDLSAWDDVAPAFEAETRVIRFDHVGCGQSDRSAFDVSKYSSIDG
jgi:sigma-B regulation protein RsbQ